MKAQAKPYSIKSLEKEVVKGQSVWIKRMKKKTFYYPDGQSTEQTLYVLDKNGMRVGIIQEFINASSCTYAMYTANLEWQYCEGKSLYNGKVVYDLEDAIAVVLTPHPHLGKEWEEVEAEYYNNK